jgi:YfiH family protein
MLLSPVLRHSPRIVHGFGTRADDMAELLPAYWRNRPVQHERHGTRIAIVGRPNEDCGEADGMFTEQPGLLLSIATADCVPVLLARSDGKAVAALHAGWRGALAGIVARFAELLRERGDDPGNWLAALGPSAGSCCYQVSDEVVEQFHSRHGMPMELIAPRPRQLNLSGIVERQLVQAGFGAVSAHEECTMCHREDGEQAFTFHSYRRDRETRTPVVDVQWSVVAIKAMT